MFSRDGYSIRNVYVDESSQTKARYLVIGGITVMASLARRLEEDLLQTRLPSLPGGELKWTKVSPAKFDTYKSIIDLLFAPAWLDQVQFHSVVIDTQKLRHGEYNQGSREIGFNKEVYQLLQKFRRLHRDCVLHVYPDRRDTPQPTEELRSILNRGAKKLGDTRPWPFRRLHFMDSAKSQAIQVTDVLTGAVAYLVNERHLAPGAAMAKTALAHHIMGQAKVLSPLRDTPVSGKFTIWHRRLR